MARAAHTAALAPLLRAAAAVLAVPQARQAAFFPAVVEVFMAAAAALLGTATSPVTARAALSVLSGPVTPVSSQAQT